MLLLAGISLLAFMPTGYADRLSTITDISADRTGSAEGRWQDFQIALDIVSHHPVIGAGIGEDFDKAVGGLVGLGPAIGEEEEFACLVIYP